jgi:hypothetical protein
MVSMEKPSFVFSALSYTIHPEESQVLFAIFLEIRNLPPDGTFPERRYPGKRAAKKRKKLLTESGLPAIIHHVLRA